METFILLYSLRQIVVLVLSLITRGWALMMLWGWYISPLFKLPTITIIQAIGMFLVGIMLVSSGKSSSDSDEESLFYESIEVILGPIIVVLIGWLILQFA